MVVYAVREFVRKLAASAASLDYVKFQAVIKSAASQPLWGGCASGRLGPLENQFLDRASSQKLIKISGSGLWQASAEFRHLVVGRPSIRPSVCRDLIKLAAIAAFSEGDSRL